jgi:hypothetical protein
LRRIGIDEISDKGPQVALTVVVNHDTGRLMWAEPGLTGRRWRSSLTRSA